MHFDNEDFDFTRFEPLSRFYLKLINRSIDINVAKLKAEEFKNEMDSLKKRKQINIQTTQIKKMS